MLLFFSSDSSPLYKKGIPQLLSLPKGHCVHFRYWDAIIDPSIVVNLNQLKGREGLIVYCKDNNQVQPNQLPPVQFLAVRRVEVVKCRRDPQTNLIHFSLEVGDFIDHSEATIKYQKNLPVNPKLFSLLPTGQVMVSPNKSIPPDLFVINGEITIDKKCNWFKVVENLVRFDPTFDNSLFYHVNLLKFEEGSQVSIDKQFDDDDESTFFKLGESKAYILDLSIYIAEANAQNIENYECRLEYNQQDILISNPSNIIIGAQRDNRRYKLITNNIQDVHSFEYLKIISVKKNAGGGVDEFYENVLHFKICKSKWRAMAFVGLMLLNVIGTAAFAYAIAEKQFLYIIPALVLVLTSALCQYFFYNKS